MPRTFIDAGILIAAARGEDDLAMRAMAVLDDPDREFVSSAFVKLEVIPRPTYHHRPSEVDFMDDFFREVKQWAEVNQSLVEAAWGRPARTDSTLSMRCTSRLRRLWALMNSSPQKKRPSLSAGCGPLE